MGVKNNNSWEDSEATIPWGKPNFQHHTHTQNGSQIDSWLHERASGKQGFARDPEAAATWAWPPLPESEERAAVFGGCMALLWRKTPCLQAWQAPARRWNAAAAVLKEHRLAAQSGGSMKARITGIVCMRRRQRGSKRFRDLHKKPPNLHCPASKLRQELSGCPTVQCQRS